MKYPYFPNIFKIFVVKLKLGVTNITLVLKFMKKNKFYYFQTAKVANSKNV